MTDAQSPTALLPCPFCGKADAFVERADFSSAYVTCNHCGARGPTDCQESDDEDTPGEAAAIAAWNRRDRAARPVSDEMVERVKSAIKAHVVYFDGLVHSIDLPGAARAALEAAALPAAPVTIPDGWKRTMVEQTQHDWAKSTLGHGEAMCRNCFMTNREAAVLGLLNVCEAAPLVAEDRKETSSDNAG